MIYIYCLMVYNYLTFSKSYDNDYDKTKETKFIMYDDMNNLYGWAMNQCLPFGNYEWKNILSLENEIIF